MKKLLSLFLALAAPCFALDIENGLDASQQGRVRSGIGFSSTAPTTIGKNLIISANPGAIAFPQAQADNTILWNSQAAQQTALGITSLGTTTPGTGVTDALGINVGTAGGIVTNGGAGGTPLSITLTNGTGLPLTTGVTGTLGVTNGGNGLATATLGDIRYGSGTNTIAALAGNTSATMAVLTQTGNGSVSAAPVWTTTSGTGGIARLDIPTFTTRIQSPIYRGTGTDIVLQDGSGNQAFRSINATTWTDSAAGQYFQIGGSSVNVIFTAGSASNITRLGHFAENFQISSGSRASAPIPADRFEIVNSSNAKVFGITNAGLVTSATGTTSKVVRHGGKIKDFLANAGNVDTTETDLFTYTTEAGILANDGETIKGTFAGSFLSSGGTATRQVKLYFGGSEIFDTSALTLTSDTSWEIEFTISRTSSSTVRAVVRASCGGISTIISPVYAAPTGLTLSGTNILKATGTAAGAGAATNDIVAKLGAVYWFPAGL